MPTDELDKTAQGKCRFFPPPGIIAEIRSKEPIPAINEVDVNDSGMSIGARVICSMMESVETTAFDRTGPALARPPKSP